MLQIRFHPNFKSAATLLFAGSHADIARLRCVFLEWKGETLDLVKHLQEKGNIYLFSVAELHLQRTTKGKSFTWRDDKGKWLISKAYQEQIIGLLDGLLDSDKAGHQYFDVGESHIQIMVAKDEYPLPQTP
jgi:hypothetical protein